LYREISDLSDIDIVNMVRNDQIDIAIDLNGLTENNRKYIFDYRVAPVQINYLGYPGTMGSRSHDYIIADKVLIPEESKRFYTEKILYLPNSSLPYDDTTKISPNRFRREDLGLPSKGFIFACFNNTKKISRNEFHIWMNLLKKIDQSYLWLIKPNQEAINNIHLEISKYGIEKERIIFAERMRLDNHLSRHYCADLFLDTFNFNAASTASIALSCGLPIITLFGKSYTARIAASILSACNLNELITHNLKEYEKLAYELATNREKFNQIRRKLKNNANLHFNSGKYTRELEKIYINIMNTSLVKDKGYNTE
jgi:protein O-GlcNAc transferase